MRIYRHPHVPMETSPSEDIPPTRQGIAYIRPGEQSPSVRAITSDTVWGILDWAVIIRDGGTIKITSWQAVERVDA